MAAYEIVQCLDEGKSSAVFRGRSPDGRSVILKSVRSGAGRPLAHLRTEHAVLSRLREEAVDGVPRPIELTRVDGRHTLVFEDDGGVTLRSHLDDGPLPPARASRIGASLAAILEQVHRQGVVHKDVKPSNILVDEGDRVVLIDFGISSLLASEQQDREASALQGTLAYISPEQTGRINRPVDRRSDLYSLGVTLFEMLAGRRPFPSEDPIELVHQHIVKTAPRVDAVDGALPSLLADLVSRLLEKDPARRYQTAAGVAWDLSVLAEDLAAGEAVPFPLGVHDRSDRFAIPHRLFGRDAPREELLAAFSRSADGGSEFVSVGGWSGIGKSALIHEIHAPVVTRRGLFGEGKFDQYTRNVPYAGVVQAFERLVAGLLAESEERVARWRARLVEALGPLLPVAVSALPDLAHIVGPQPAPPTLSAEAERHRFQGTFLELIGVFSSAEHPLVLFLDDMQWADQPSLSLLEVLLSDDTVGHLLVVVAYRDNEVDPSHPFEILRSRLRVARAEKQLAPENAITLAGLARGDLVDLVAATLGAEPATVEALAELVLDKTGGNPFFVRQFLHALHRDGLFGFDPDDGWIWDLDEIRAQQLTDNVIELMARKLGELPDAARDALSLAACIGNSFAIATLGQVSGDARIADALWPALRDGFLVPLDADYRLVVGSSDYAAVHADDEGPSPNARFRFLHDRVQQAAYDAIPAADRAGAHLRIGRTLLAAGADVHDVFAVAEQFQHGLHLVDDADERRRLAELFGRAGDHARLNAAYEPALSFLDAGLELLGDARWTSGYELGAAMMRGRAICLYMAHRLDDANAVTEEILANSRTDLERMQIYNLKIEIFARRSFFVEAVALAVDGVRLAGVELPVEPTMEDMGAELGATQQLLAGTDPAALPDLPAADDPLVVTALKILNNVVAAAMFTGVPMGTIVILKMTQLSFTHGNSADSAFAWSLFGLVTGPILGDYALGLKYHAAGLAVKEQYPDVELKAKMSTAVGLLSHWGDHPRVVLGPLQAGFDAALESGDPMHAHYASAQQVAAEWLMGRPLSVVAEHSQKYLEFARRNRIHESSHGFAMTLRAIDALRGKTHAVGAFGDADWDEAAYEAEVEGFTHPLTPHLWHAKKAAVLLYLGEPSRAWAHAQRGTNWDLAVAGNPQTTLNRWYRAVAAPLHVRTLDGEAATEVRGLLDQDLAQLAIWEENAPQGFTHKRLHVEAEVAWLEGRELDAMNGFDRAIAEAGAQSFLHDEAWSNERAAALHLESGRDRVASVYLRAARELWARWGASLRVRQLDEAHPELAVRVTTTRTLDSTVSSTTTSDRLIDLLTVLRASEALSEKLVLSDLLDTLMRLALANTGARRVLLLLDRDGELVTAGELREGAAAAPSGVPLSGRDDLARSVVQYVARTLEPVVLSDVTQASDWVGDPWVRDRRTKGVLCAPLLRRGELVGVLYLENDATAGVFTPERLELLRLLSGQMATSIENARLYGEQQELAEGNRRLADSFARFVPREFLAHLGRASVAEVGLGEAVQREMTVLFSDIRAFTALSERLTAAESFAFINRYLSRVGPVIREHGGFIDKFVGDAVMALFPRGPADALAAAVSMQRAVREMNAEGGEPVRIGIGIHHGTLMLGTIGEAERMDGSVISDVVNTASRLEGLTKAYDASVLVSGSALALCADTVRPRSRYLGEVRPRGRTSAVRLHHVFEGSDAAPEYARTLSAFEGAVRQFVEGDVKAARDGFAAVLAETPGDGAAAAYLTRCEDLIFAESAGATSLVRPLDAEL